LFLNQIEIDQDTMDKHANICNECVRKMIDRCHTYETTGSDMSVSLSAKRSH